ncbi:MAG: ABC transporter permease subunit [Alphaproteobacteria bacterium]|nr:ABC transporter permease subunit [Alphaproteobacteria bacterium]
MKVFWIARREIEAMFSTTIGWLVLTAYLLVTGVFWFAGVVAYVERSTDLVYNPYGAPEMQLPMLVSEFFGSCSIVVLMIAPAISMRLFADELKQHTMELLFTSPVSVLEIVLGKYLGAMGFLAMLMLCTAHYPVSLALFGDPHLPSFALGYATLLLMGSVLIAIGMVFSAYTSNQIVASVLTLGASLALFLVSVLADTPDDWQAKIALSSHLSELLTGIVRVSDLAYFVLLTLVALFVTHQRLESFRWR